MDIAEVAKAAGVPSSTLRYQLALIALGRAAGFSLDEIRSMFSPEGQPSIDRQMLSAKADEIDRKAARLRAMSRGLRHAAVCPASSHAECPTKSVGRQGARRLFSPNVLNRSVTRPSFASPKSSSAIGSFVSGCGGANSEPWTMLYLANGPAQSSWMTQLSPGIRSENSCSSAGVMSSATLAAKTAPMRGST